MIKDHKDFRPRGHDDVRAYMIRTIAVFRKAFSNMGSLVWVNAIVRTSKNEMFSWSWIVSSLLSSSRWLWYIYIYNDGNADYYDHDHDHDQLLINNYWSIIDHDHDHDHDQLLLILISLPFYNAYHDINRLCMSHICQCIDCEFLSIKVKYHPTNKFVPYYLICVIFLFNIQN